MKYICRYNNLNNCESIDLPLSKSISNRFLIAKALSENSDLDIPFSKADDSIILNNTLTKLDPKINVGKAGTALRFLTAYLATLKKEYVLDGDSRMRERPIGVLVDQLRELGATITYLGRKGFPPIQINGGKLKAKKLNIDANISSQFISALMLIAPTLENNLELKMEGNVVSSPYIDMTLKLMSEWGIDLLRNDTSIQIKKGTYKIKSDYRIESDWSSAAFIYQSFALSMLDKVFINSLSLDSVQGDARIAEIFKFFGVETRASKSGLELSKIEFKKEAIYLDMLDVPDLVPVVVVTAAALDITLELKGVGTLKNKESDRLEALQKELSKFNSILRFDDDTLSLMGSIQLENGIVIDTYQDHRIAMAFAPLATIGEITIDNPEVVKKSFPNFWNEIEKMGIQTELLFN